jgi:hypothetical protein
MPTYNDGSVPYGFGTSSATLFDSPAGGTIASYVVESVTLDEGGFQIERRTGSNVMSGRVAGDDSDFGGAIPRNKTGTARLQRTTTSTAAPKVGNGIAFDSELASPFTFNIFVVTGVAHAYGQAEAHTFDVRFAATSNEF